MQEKFFHVKWRGPVVGIDTVYFSFIVIANSKEDAEEKIRRAKKITNELEIVECIPKDGIIYLGCARPDFEE